MFLSDFLVINKRENTFPDYGLFGPSSTARHVSFKIEHEISQLQVPVAVHLASTGLGTPPTDECRWSNLPKYGQILFKSKGQKHKKIEKFLDFKIEVYTNFLTSKFRIAYIKEWVDQVLNNLVPIEY